MRLIGTGLEKLLDAVHLCFGFVSVARSRRHPCDEALAHGASLTGLATQSEAPDYVTTVGMVGSGVLGWLVVR